jgi:hypothetical protein
MARQYLQNIIIRASTIILPLIIAIPPTPPYVFNNNEQIIKLLVNFMLLLVAFQIPSPANLCHIMSRLDPQFHGFTFGGRDIFQAIENQRYLFWLNTGELPETMLDITANISRNLLRLTSRGRVRHQIRSSKLSNINKVLLTLMWLRKYPCLDTMALLFDVSPSTVLHIIQCCSDLVEILP